MEVKQEIIENLKKAIAELTSPDENISISLQEPKDESHGDYSSNIAMAIFAKLKSQSSNLKATAQNIELKNPLDLAKEIVSSLNSKYLISDTNRIEAIAPGFINFYLSEHYLIDHLESIKEHLLQGQALQARKIVVEYTDPNPFKEFHIGHLYSNTVGEAMCRILESQGAIVKRVCYQGDVGLHVAKALYGLSLVHPNLFLDPQEMLKQVQHDTLQEKVKLLGKAYAQGTAAYEESEEAKKEINGLNKKIYDQDPSIKEIYEKGKAWSLEYFETIYKRLGTKFADYYFESEVGQVGLEYVKKHMNIFEESQGAVIFPGEKYGLHNRVFINSQGLPTYEAKELGLAPTKYKDFPYDQSIIITGNEINEYFRVLLKALSLINPDLAAKTKHIGHGMVRLPGGKMSSRTGQVVTGGWLLDEAKKRIQEQYKDMDQKTAEMVAVGAVKYALLKSGIGRDTVFSFEESISLEGNSGPYLQYTYARTQSVLAKVKSQKSKVKTTTQNAKFGRKLYAEELVLLRTLHRFPEVVQEAAEKFSPNIVALFLFDLAQKFNLFYQKHSILDSDAKEFRVVLTAGVGQVLKNGLRLLGIEAPERM